MLWPRLSRTRRPEREIVFEGIGTAWQIHLFQPVAEHTLEQLKNAVVARVQEFDRNYSRFRDDSLVTQMSRSGEIFALPADAQPLLDLYVEMERLSDGLVTPLIGKTLEEAGYDPEYSLKPGRLTMPPRWDDAVEYDFPKIRLTRPLLLDVGAAGKGYLVDLVAKLLGEHGVSDFLIDAGGDLFYANPGGEPMPVGLEDPGAEGEAVGILRLPADKSVCGSAGNRRRWDRFTHIINPKTLRSPDEIEAIWVLADTALLADMLATALFFVPYDKLRKRYTFEYALLHKGYSLSHSRGFPADFFTKEH